MMNKLTQIRLFSGKSQTITLTVERTVDTVKVLKLKGPDDMFSVGSTVLEAIKVDKPVVRLARRHFLKKVEPKVDERSALQDMKDKISLYLAEAKSDSTGLTANKAREDNLKNTIQKLKEKLNESMTQKSATVPVAPGSVGSTSNSLVPAMTTPVPVAPGSLGSTVPVVTDLALPEEMFDDLEDNFISPLSLKLLKLREDLNMKPEIKDDAAVDLKTQQLYLKNLQDEISMHKAEADANLMPKNLDQRIIDWCKKHPLTIVIGLVTLILGIPGLTRLKRLLAPSPGQELGSNIADAGRGIGQGVREITQGVSDGLATLKKAVRDFVMGDSNKSK